MFISIEGRAWSNLCFRLAETLQDLYPFLGQTLKGALLTFVQPIKVFVLILRDLEGFSIIRQNLEGLYAPYFLNLFSPIFCG